jgi:hypothetical protein
MHGVMYREMSDPIRCACSGEAENCSRCFGSGFFLPPDLTGRTRPLRQKMATSRSVPPKVWRLTFAQAAAAAAAERDDATSAAIERHRFANEQVRCPFCKLTSQRWQIRKHAEKKHRNKTFRNADCVPVISTRSADLASRIPTVPPDKHCANQSQLTKAEIHSQDPLDATRNMGYLAREGPRYGSHPIHDGYDDESKP